MRWLNDLREALFGGKTRPPRDYPSKRRWFAQRILPLIQRPIYAVFIAPLENLGDRLERLTLAELAVIETAAKEVLGENFMGLRREIWSSPEDGTQLETVHIEVRQRVSWKRGGPEDQIRDRAIAIRPAISDAHIVLRFHEPETAAVAAEN